MGKGSTVIVPIVALILGILAIALSFAAYATRIKVEDVNILSDGSCEYGHSPACALGIIAALCLLIEQILVSAGSGCFCCRGNSCPKNCGGVMALILFIFSWLAFIIAFMGLIFTAIENNSSFLAKAGTNNNNVNDTNYTCYLGKETLFIVAAIWCLICVFFGLLSYFLLNACCKSNTYRTRNTGNLANEQGVPMGQPKGQY